LEYVGRISEAHREFVFVSERDPNDAHVWLRVGSTLSDPEDPDRPAGLKQADELIALYERPLKLNPYRVAKLWKLSQTYGWAGRRDKQNELQRVFHGLNPQEKVTATGEMAENVYGSMGKYASIIDPVNAPKIAHSPALPPRFDVPAP